MKHTIENKAHLFEIWEREARRFKKLFGGLSKEQLKEEAITSGCGHTLGEHIICMLIWMETAIEYFSALLGNQKKPEIGDMLVYTNRQIAKYRGVSYRKIWQLLKQAEENYKSLINRGDEHDLFTDKEKWDYLVWTSFGHYDEHSTELEWQLMGKKSIPEDEVWVPSLNKAV